FLAVVIAPFLLGLVAAFNINHVRIPIRFFARHVIAALEQQDLLAGGRELVCQRPAAGAGANNDHVVVCVGSHMFLLIARDERSVVAAEDAPLAVVVMKLGAEYTMDSTSQAEQLCSAQHAKSWRGEINPQCSPFLRRESG